LRRSNRFGGYQGLSRFEFVVLHQGAIERLLQKTIHEHSDIRVERAVIPEKLEFDESETDEYPLSITLRHLTKDDTVPDQGSDIVNGVFRSNLVKDNTDDLIKKGQDRGYSSEVVKAKYLFGCDGAHSVREIPSKYFLVKTF
jgi:2-polyprenyl-6-methoxyphenol hydroxylase-like FAD-dependent oxidoreductase